MYSRIFKAGEYRCFCSFDLLILANDLTQMIITRPSMLIAMPHPFGRQSKVRT